MEYTISVAWVVSVEPEKFEDRDGDPLHTDIMGHVTTMAELMRARYADRDFRVVLAEIVSSPETVLAEKR